MILSVLLGGRCAGILAWIDEADYPRCRKYDVAWIGTFVSESDGLLLGGLQVLSQFCSQVSCYRFFIDALQIIVSIISLLAFIADLSRCDDTGLTFKS